MKKEWNWKAKNGKAFFSAGVGQMSAVGTEKPGDDIPLGEGARLLFTRAVDRWWQAAAAVAAVKRLTRGKRRRKRR